MYYKIVTSFVGPYGQLESIEYGSIIWNMCHCGDLIALLWRETNQFS